MEVSEARNLFRKLTEQYFTQATVEFAKQSFAVKKEKPLVLLTFGSIERPLNPPTTIVDGRPVSFYPTTMTVQVDLFTKGRVRSIAKGITSAMENTAEEDLLSFVNFLNSPYAVNYCHNNDIAILVPNTVMDLTDLINDTNYEYRAMVEVQLNFTTIAIGYTGSISPTGVKKNGSGSAEGSGSTGGGIEGGSGSTDGSAGSGSAGGEGTSGSSGVDVSGSKDFDWNSDEFDDSTTIEATYEGNSSGGGALDMETEDSGFFSNVSINNKLIKEDDEQ
jgi:hypothetical protein